MLQTHIHQQRQVRQPVDPVASAFDRTKQFIQWALSAQPLFHKKIEQRVATHEAKANAAAWEAIKYQELWEKRDALRATREPSPKPALKGNKASSSPDDLLIHRGLAHALESVRSETLARKALGDIPTEVLTPSPKEEGDTATQPAIRTQRWYTLSLSTGEDLLTAIDRHIAEYQDVLNLRPQKLRIGTFFSYQLALRDFATMYTRGGADLVIVTDPTLRKNQIILE